MRQQNKNEKVNGVVGRIMSAVKNHRVFFSILLLGLITNSAFTAHYTLFHGHGSFGDKLYDFFTVVTVYSPFVFISWWLFAFRFGTKIISNFCVVGFGLTMMIVAAFFYYLFIVENYERSVAFYHLILVHFFQLLVVALFYYTTSPDDGRATSD